MAKKNIGPQFWFWLFLITFGGVVTYDTYREKEETMPPPSVQTLTTKDCLVGVSTLQNGQRRYGTGVVVEKNGMVFILTSAMLFVDNPELIEVTVGPWTTKARVIGSNESLGLVGLSSDIEFVSGFAVTSLPDLPMVEVCTYSDSWKIHALESINDNWVLASDLNEDCVGAPIVNGCQLVGMMVGMNGRNPSEAIVVNNLGINTFIDFIKWDEQ